MALVSTPYRWLWRTWYKNVNHWYYDIKNGLSNLHTFFNAVWWFRAWDFVGLLALIQTSTDQMHKDQATTAYAGSLKEAKRLLVVRELCKRLREDKYFDMAGFSREDWDTLPQYTRTQMSTHAHYLSKQDAEHLGKMFRFIQYWWT